VHIGFWWTYLIATNNFEGKVVGGREILMSILKKWDVRRGLESAGSG
jgi:hypothetical protein